MTTPSAKENRYLCIHGHFYQPPRENPWLEEVELQDSATPYHDWNERVTAECYAPNSAARILDTEGRIAKIVNNYANISFNFGPTLLSWLKENAPRTYRMILDGERRSRKNFKGHSSAMAQVYNHVIMPLANRRDKITQIRWGIADYQHHYGVAPEGMWLAETAVDTDTLELLAQHGIKFTVLAPHQCKRIRSLKNGDSDATDGTLRPMWSAMRCNVQPRRCLSTTTSRCGSGSDVKASARRSTCSWRTTCSDGDMPSAASHASSRADDWSSVSAIERSTVTSRPNLRTASVSVLARIRRSQAASSPSVWPRN